VLFAIDLKVAVSCVLMPLSCILTPLLEISRANFVALCVQVLKPAEYRTADPAAQKRQATMGRWCPLLAPEGAKEKHKDFVKYMSKAYKHAVNIIQAVCASPANAGLDHATLFLDAQKLCDGDAVEGEVSLADLAPEFSTIPLTW
jgi:hypothetical protein